MTRRERRSRNYLEFIPLRDLGLPWREREPGLVTLTAAHRGFFNRVAQRCFGRPAASRIDLDQQGSFVWLQIDGARPVGEIGALLEARFGEEAAPLYPRLVRFIELLREYRFIRWNTE